MRAPGASARAARRSQPLQRKARRRLRRAAVAAASQQLHGLQAAPALTLPGPGRSHTAAGARRCAPQRQHTRCNSHPAAGCAAAHDGLHPAKGVHLPPRCRVDRYQGGESSSCAAANRMQQLCCRARIAVCTTRVYTHLLKQQHSCLEPLTATNAYVVCFNCSNLRKAKPTSASWRTIPSAPPPQTPTTAAASAPALSA